MIIDEMKKQISEVTKKQLEESVKNKLENEVKNKIEEFTVYSKIDELPKGHASKNVIDGCVVCEGGAFRAVYGEGVLDALMVHDINMSCCIGISAGAMNGMNYISGQIGRSARVNLRYRFDSRYVGLTAMKNNHGIIGFDFVLEGMDELDPFDYASFNDPRKRFVAGATDLATGKAVYFENGKCSDIMKAVQASASMPYVSEAVEVEGKLCLDGGCADRIPFEWALQEGYDKIIVIKTRDEMYRKPETDTGLLVDLTYHDYPEFSEVFKNSAKDYNAEMDELEKLETQGRVFVIEPSTPVTVGRLEHDLEKLGDLYWQGYHDAEARMDALKEYLCK